MRYTFSQLALLPLAASIAVILPDPFVWNFARINYREIAVFNELHAYRIYFETKYVVEKRPLPSTIEEIRQAIDQEYPNVDSWGNPYQFVLMRKKGCWGCENPVHIHSLGRDGKSETNGNDPDDISSWKEKPIEYYGQEIRNEIKRERLRVTAIWTPFLVLALLMIHKWYGRKKNRRIHGKRK